MNRRQFFKAGMGAAAFLAFRSRAKAFYQSPGLRKFIQPLRGAGPGGIPVAVPDLSPAPVTGVTHYTVGIEQFTDTLHPDLGPTILRGYVPTRALGVTGTVTPRHLGGIVIAQKGKPIQFTFRNKLSGLGPIPVDATIPGAELGGMDSRTAVHLHGGLVPWISDGGPFDWWDASGTHGKSFLNNILNPGAKPNEAEYYYPNDQTARMMWYHDHAFGITRINAYAGVATAYIIRDPFESGLRNLGLPDFVENGGREIPLVIQDKIFVGPGILNLDPTWPGPTDPGSLWYAHTYDPDRWDLATGAPLPDPSVIPEFFGDTMLANGTVYPEATVEARRYRFRILNACNARFLNLQLYVDDGSPDGIALDSAFNPTNKPGPSFFQIGTEGGFLTTPAVVPSNVPFNVVTLKGSLIMAPAERADLIIDFKGFAGKNLILYTDAPAPFPSGDDRNDYFPGKPNNPTQPMPGFGPNTRQITRFKVVPATGRPDPPMLIGPNFPLGLGNSVLMQFFDLQAYKRFQLRRLTLNESSDGYGRLIQNLGTNVATGPGAFGRAYTDDPTETPRAGAIEVWQIANLTGDTHPIHFHLVNVQILARQPFDPVSYNGTPTYIGPARPPDQNELGWKETVRMNPGEVTTVAMKFDLAKVPFHVPSSPRTGGNEFVWHCHILEHEEHDMMRPLVVT